MTITLAFEILKTILGLLFATGCVRAFFSFDTRSASPAHRSLIFVLLGTFLLPFLSYAVIGLFTPKFGHIRNFFYLLPVYFIFVFYGLDALIRSRWLFRAAASLLFLSLITIELTGDKITTPDLFKISAGSKEAYEGRAILRLAASVDADEVFVPYTFGHTPWIFNYYMKKFQGLGKVFPYFPANAKNKDRSPASQTDEEFDPRVYSYTPWLFKYYARGLDLSGKSFPYFQKTKPGFFGKRTGPRPLRRIAVIEENMALQSPATGNSYSFGGEILRIEKMENDQIPARPGGLPGIFMSPFSAVTVYFLQSN